MLHKIRFILFSFLLLTTQIFAFNTAPGVENNPDNYLEVFWQGQGTFTFLSDRAALSTLVELGDRNYRINETLGFTDQTQTNRFKLGVEFLKQNIDYTFYSGVTRKWVNQIATGITYQYIPNMNFLGSFEVGAFYSHAPNHDLATRSGDILEGDFINGTITHYINDRRIAGSNAGGANAGFSFYLWQGAELGLALNYDYVHYDMYFEQNDSANGIGGSAYFNQYISNRFKIDALSEVRAPFDYYRLGLSWLLPSSIGNFELGVNGGYVNGKHLLPDTKTLGITLNYIFGKNAGWQIPPCPKTLSEWTAKPAVYLPQVLAVKDERVSYTSRLQCLRPTFTGTIPNQGVVSDTAITPINAAAFFSGSPDLTYTLIGDPWGTVTIDPVTGIISGIAPDDISSVQYIVQATNSCGVVQSNVFTLSACELPAFTGPPIDDQLNLISGNMITPINSAPLFTPGSGLVYSLLGGAPLWNIIIDPVTGVVTGLVPGSPAPAQSFYMVQAASDCGVAVSNTFLLEIQNA